MKGVRLLECIFGLAFPHLGTKIVCIGEWNISVMEVAEDERG